jgi:hypothetical protein
LRSKINTEMQVVNSDLYVFKASFLINRTGEADC